jgi:hypothetical protein
MTILSSGYIGCCTREEVIVGDCGRFHRLLCIHCGEFSDEYKEHEDLAPEEIPEAIAQHNECRMCTGTIIPIFSYCLSCPKRQ